MSHIVLSIQCPNPATKELLLAQLASMGFDGFEEKGLSLLAYQPTEQYNEVELQTWLEKEGLSFTIQLLEDQNWNAIWESNFEPVEIEGFCTIRADFHESKHGTPYEIVITPKMSFGTGHHATTYLMIQAMQGLDLKGKSVFDFGTGTAVLAILAYQLGAARVEAIDNDHWSMENAKENITRNHCPEIVLYQADSIPNQGRYDLILANINRHILLQEMEAMRACLSEQGQILMSGVLLEDQAMLTEAAARVGLTSTQVTQRDSWICLHYTLKA